MSNELDNGAILPFGLMSGHGDGLLEGFKKTYQNTSLRVGLVKESYGTDDPKNISKLVPEYDVIVFEQNEDRGAVPITYKNCPASEGFGSLADFFEFTLRKLKKKTSKGETPSMNGQNAAIVLLLCLDGMSEKGIIVGCLHHPDRKSKIKSAEPHLEGEYNGVHIKVDKTGACTFTFKGATDNDGKLLDETQGPTTVKIEKDGSFQVGHKTITLRLDKTGDVILTSDGNINVTTKKNAVVHADGNIDVSCVDATVTASGKSTVTCAEAILQASGNALVEGKNIKLGSAATEAVVKGDTFKKLFDAHIHPTAVGPSGPPSKPLDPSALSKKVKTE